MPKFQVDYEVVKVATIEAKNEEEAIERASSEDLEWVEGEITRPLEASQLL
jgi:hypothetical protein